MLINKCEDMRSKLDSHSVCTKNRNVNFYVKERIVVFSLLVMFLTAIKVAV